MLLQVRSVSFRIGEGRSGYVRSDKVLYVMLCLVSSGYARWIQVTPGSFGI